MTASVELNGPEIPVIFPEVISVEPTDALTAEIESIAVIVCAVTFPPTPKPPDPEITTAPLVLASLIVPSEKDTIPENSLLFEILEAIVSNPALSIVASPDNTTPDATLDPLPTIILPLVNTELNLDPKEFQSELDNNPEVEPLLQG